MTVVTDRYFGRVLHAVEGKGKEDIRPFLETLAKRGKKLEAVAMDMSSVYFWAVREVLPRVKVVFDRFHVVSLMNQAIDELRRSHQAEHDSFGQETLKGRRFLLLRNYDSLVPDRKAKLDALLKINRPLFEIHSMKEQLRLSWELDNREEAEQFLVTWCRDAMNSGIKALKRVGKTPPTEPDCSTTLITTSPVAPSRALSTKSKPSKGKLMGFEIPSLSIYGSSTYTLRGTSLRDKSIFLNCILSRSQS